MKIYLRRQQKEILLRGYFDSLFGLFLKKKSFWNVNLQIILLVPTSESICSCTAARGAEGRSKVRTENVKRRTKKQQENRRTEREGERQGVEEEGRANRGGNECIKGLRVWSGLKVPAPSKQATAACQTFDQGLMNEANKSHSDTLEAFSPKQACQSH